MADYWRYQDRLGAGQLLTKRPRTELDDALLHGAAGYGRGELRYDERDARLLDLGLDYGKTGVSLSFPGRICLSRFWTWGCYSFRCECDKGS
ncbi:hypothetical protein GOP47_0028162 [Adiantum capillus-veneris]|nr:hypothetical protein GOP47_0028162 [Adiantum capillus-veneris]